MEGSDTMSSVAQAWAEKYHAGHPEALIQVLSPGSGVGIAGLIDGNCDMANASRAMEDKEIQSLWDNRHLKAKEHIVGYDALAVYVHKDNPLDSISFDELKEIYGKDGKITKWSQLGVDPKKLGTDKIVLVSRQNNSGTYAYFAETVLGKGGQYKLGTLDQIGSEHVVTLVANTPGAIGYSGMGFAAAGVKMLQVARHKGEPAVAPTVENALKKTNGYPITRPLYIYTAGEPTGKVKAFLDWILGKEGQQVLVKQGYVSVLLHE